MTSAAGSTSSAASAALLTGYAAAGTIVLLWTGFILVSRSGVQGSLTPYDIGALRFGVAGLVVAPFLLLRGLGDFSLSQALTMAILAGVGFSTLALTGFLFAPAAHAGVLLPGILPLYTAILATLLGTERPTGRRLIGLCIVVVGVALVASGSLGGGARTWIGDLLFASASFCWAIFTVLLVRWRANALHASAIVAGFSAILYLPAYLVLHGTGTLFAAPWQEILLQGAYQGIVATILSAFLFAVAVRRLGPGRTTVLTAWVPSLAALAAVPLLGEPLGWTAAAGAAATTLGILVAVTAARTRT